MSFIQIPSTNIATLKNNSSKNTLISVKGFVFKGWKDLLKIQKDKSYDFAIVFFQDVRIKNLPNMTKVISPKIIFFYGAKGCENEIVKHYENQFNNP